MAKAKPENQEPLEKQLWKAADKLRKNIDAAEYKHIVQGLIFLKYISDSFEEHFAKLQAGLGEYAGADPEDKDEYKAENVFFVPETARWSYLQAKARRNTIGKDVDNAMDANPAIVTVKVVVNIATTKYRTRLILPVSFLDLFLKFPFPVVNLFLRISSHLKCSSQVYV